MTNTSIPHLFGGRTRVQVSWSAGGLAHISTGDDRHDGDSQIPHGPDVILDAAGRAALIEALTTDATSGPEGTR